MGAATAEAGEFTLVSFRGGVVYIVNGIVETAEEWHASRIESSTQKRAYSASYRTLEVKKNEHLRDESVSPLKKAILIENFESVPTSGRGEIDQEGFFDRVNADYKYSASSYKALQVELGKFEKYRDSGYKVDFSMISRENLNALKEALDEAIESRHLIHGKYKNGEIEGDYVVHFLKLEEDAREMIRSYRSYLKNKNLKEWEQKQVERLGRVAHSSAIPLIFTLSLID